MIPLDNKNHIQHMRVLHQSNIGELIVDHPMESEEEGMRD